MDRKAIIIEASQVPNQKDLNGARKDVVNWVSFLTSNLGGKWSQDEITVLNTPTKQALVKAFSNITTNYLFVVFSGHGGSENGKEFICLKDECLPTCCLKILLYEHSPKATLILDCCRSEDDDTDVRVEKTPIRTEAANHVRTTHVDRRLSSRTGPIISFGGKYSGTPLGRSLTENKATPLKAIDYAAKWLESLNDCSEGIVTMWACSKGEEAGEDSSTTSKAGGYFSTALMKAAYNWNKITDPLYQIYKTSEAFTDARSLIHDPQQNPEYEPKWLAFPFAISSI